MFEKKGIEKSKQNFKEKNVNFQRKMEKIIQEKNVEKENKFQRR